jgi:nucleotide-binding universal stress UspA family protein
LARFETFLVPHDFSDDAQAALDTAVELARRLGAQLHLLHAYQQPVDVLSPYGVSVPANLGPELRAAALARLRQIAEPFAELRTEVLAVEGPPASVIAEQAEALGADLVVMGTHGRTGLRHLLLGSVAERTVRSAPCPVLTVKSREPAA